MNRIDVQIHNIKKSNKIGFMGHVIAGYPNIEVSLNAAKGISKGGANFVEVQFPFSDPTADGPTIEGACYQAIEEGFTVEKGFRLTEELIKNSNSAILIMTYANIIYRYGIGNFIDRAKSIGVSGMIIPDLPPECDENIIEICAQNDIKAILICAPGSSSERIKYLSEKGSGFLYTTMRRGITGRKTEILEETKKWLDFVKTNSILPIAAAFGIQSKDQIKTLSGLSDIAVAGSYFVNKIDECMRNNLNVEEFLCSSAKNLIS